MMTPWQMGEGIEQDDRWTVADLQQAMQKLT
jgi:hypothetical protein